MGSKITPEQLRTFWKCIDEGGSSKYASQKAGFSRGTGDAALKTGRGRELVKPKGKAAHHWAQFATTRQNGGPVDTSKIPEPTPYADLCDEAAHALEDFHFFSERYFGRAPTPWRREAADTLFDLYNHEEKKFVVVNTPPGVGKTALFTHDIPAWLTMKDRAIRGVLGSWGMATASSYVRRLRTTFERTAMVPVSDDLVQRGMEVEPGGVLAKDFGRLKPLGQGDFWTAQSFTVEQLDGRAPADKEPTWTAFGNGEIIGWRVDFLIFDDLVTTRKLESEAEQRKTRTWWTQEVEKRLEPGGLLVLEGQRLGANDHYRFCLDMMDFDEYTEIDGVDPDEMEGGSKKYHHIVYKGHYDDKCIGPGSKERHHHPSTAKPYPEGCLLDPLRCSYREQMREKAANPTLYETVYQQNDTNPDQVLVPDHWINGDDEHIGCWDRDRDSWELPAALSDFVTVVSVDPSPTKNWAVQAWAIHPESETFFLLDLFRGSMEAPAFLYGDGGTFSGKAEDMRKDFAAMGHPLRHLIFERNVAQRWFLQQPYVKDWARQYGITIHDQETHHRNKADPEYGITMLRPLFKEGRIRLPGKQTPYGESPALYTGRRNAIKLTDELTRYSLQFGASGTDDQIMACWFMANKAKKLVRPDHSAAPRLHKHRPSWLRRKVAA